jgi:hypothetical protein
VSNCYFYKQVTERGFWKKNRQSWKTTITPNIEIYLNQIIKPEDIGHHVSLPHNIIKVKNF